MGMQQAWNPRLGLLFTLWVPDNGENLSRFKFKAEDDVKRIANKGHSRMLMLNEESLDRASPTQARLDCLYLSFGSARN